VKAARQKRIIRLFTKRCSTAEAGKFSKLKCAVIFAFLFALGSGAASAQPALDFSDTAPTLESGTALSQGAVYRFKNVAPGTDALVTLTTITSNTTLVQIDNSSPFPERFQPIILTRTANAVGYVRFDFRLVKAGTNTSRPVPHMLVSAQDIDGTTSANREFVEFAGMQNAYVSGTTKLVSRTPIMSGGVSYVQQSPGESQSGIGTNDAFEFYGVMPNSTATFSIIGGNVVGPQDCTSSVGTNTCDRLNSYAFDPPSSNVTVAPDVSITKTGPASVNQNSTVTYTLVARNNGSTTAHGATVSYSVPSSLTGVTMSCVASGSAICPDTTGLTTLNNVFIPTFPNGGQVTLTISGTAATAGTLTNVATIAPPNGSTDPSTANNTSATVTTTVNAVYNITGIVFEDVSYGGGGGRSLSDSGGLGRGGVRVELYNSSGNFVSSTTTLASGTIGQYQFTGLVAGNYTVRVVNSTVTTSRSSATSLIGVQTFRTDAGANDANRVGGEDPTKVDASSNTTNATLASLTTSTTAALSVSNVSITSANVINVDFGFNYDTIVNTKDSGQGSLRQFITNTNAMTGADTSVFMISDGAAHAGLRSGLPNQLTSGVAVITVTTLLPAITDAGTTIDGTKQTSNVGNTNSGTIGTGGTVGVDSLPLSTVQRSEVQITDGATNLAVGLDLRAANSVVRGISIYGFGTSANSNTSANILLNSAATGALIEGNVIGTTASSFTDVGAGIRSIGDGIRSVGASSGTVRNNLIGYTQSKGFGVENGSTGWTIENNEIRGNAITNSYLDGIDLESSGTTNNIVRGNLIADNEGVGVDSYQSNGSNTIVNNTITNNGIGPNSNVESPGVRLYGANNTVDRNIIFANYGAGIMLTSGATANIITRNSIYNNGTILNKAGAAASGQIGIDLHTASESVTTGTSPFVTINDAGDSDGGANGGLNFPVLETAQIVAGNLILKGFARPGAAIEFFVASPDASGFGEGQTYIVTLTEGSGQDTDATNGTYTSPFNGRNVGTDTTNRFSFSVPVPAGVTAGTVLTATATLSAATSEFSNTVTIGNAPPSINLVKTVTPEGTQLPGTELIYAISFANIGGQSATNFSLIDPNPAINTLKLNNNTDFKVGSVTNSLGTTGLTTTVTYSNDSGATFTYTPVSGGGGAAAGFDRNVTHIRWVFSGSLSQTSPNNTGSVSFIVRIR
jgi:trimeric autotransporter adhesin